MRDFDQIPVPKRYILPDMAEVWGEAARYRTWATVETCAAKALGAPPEAIDDLLGAPVPTPSQVASEEAKTGHDVLAFLAAWKQDIPAGTHQWVHRGMTSSDLVDSALAFTVMNAVHLVNRRVNRLVCSLIKHSLVHQTTLMAGRTHGQVAELTTWGYRMADIAVALMNSHGRFQTAGRGAAVAKLSGPVGDYKSITPDQEYRFSQLLLGPAGRGPLTATQVVSRDRLADLVFGCSLMASVIERLATEVRLGSQTGVNEVREGATDRRMGSSAMPHKKNPVTSENLVGLARLIRAQVGPMLEDISLWNERDISHSSVERMALPTALILVDFMADRAATLIDELVVDRSQMLSNLHTYEAEVNSATARTWLVDNGLTDPDLAWEMVRSAAIKTDGAGYRFPTTLAALVREWMNDNASGVRFPDFAPNWTELTEACALSTKRANTDHVFKELARIIEPVKDPEF